MHYCKHSNHAYILSSIRRNRLLKGPEGEGLKLGGLRAKRFLENFSSKPTRDFKAKLQLPNCSGGGAISDESPTHSLSAGFLGNQHAVMRESNILPILFIQFLNIPRLLTNKSTI